MYAIKAHGKWLCWGYVGGWRAIVLDGMGHVWGDLNGCEEVATFRHIWQAEKAARKYGPCAEVIEIRHYEAQK